MKIHKPALPVSLLFFVLFSSVNGQSTGELSYTTATLVENSSMSITGSSTLHIWSVDAQEYSVEFIIPESWFESEENWLGADVEELIVNVPVEHLDGGKNKMNRDLREALKFEDYPEILFQWDEIHFLGKTDTDRKAEINGRIEVAGVESRISFQSDLHLNEWSQIVAEGNVSINMKEYGIKPPKAFFGLIKSDENITIVYELYLDTGEERNSLN